MTKAAPGGPAASAGQIIPFAGAHTGTQAARASIFKRAGQQRFSGFVFSHCVEVSICAIVPRDRSEPY